MERVRPLTTQAVEVDLSRQNFRRMQKRPILHSELNAPRIEAASTTTLVHAVTNIVPSSITRGRGRAHGGGRGSRGRGRGRTGFTTPVIE